MKQIVEEYYIKEESHDYPAPIKKTLTKQEEIKRYEAQDQASKLIFGEGINQTLAGTVDRELPPIIKTENDKYKFYDGKREYQSEETAKRAFIGYQKFLAKQNTKTE